MPHIVILDGGESSIHDLARDETVIGRDPDCHVRIESHAVSRRHARIVRDGERFLVEDSGSRNGTLVNGTRIASAVRLTHDDFVQLGPVRIRFVDRAVTADVREARRERIRELSRALAGAVDLDVILSRTLETLLAIFREADRGCMLLRAGTAGQTEGQLVPRAVIHRHPSPDAPVKISHAILSHVISEKKGILTADATGDGQVEPDEPIACRTIGSLMCVPLLGAQGDALGVLAIDTRNRLEQFQSEDLEVMTNVARLAALSCEQARLDGTAAAALPASGRQDLAGLAGNGPSEIDRTGGRSADLAEVTGSCNRFAFDLHSKLAGRPGNLFFSPSNIAMALGMTLAGAAAATAEEIAEVLHATLPEDRFHEGLRELQNATQTGRDGLKLANRLWGQAGHRFLPAFQEATERCYGARLAELDFRAAAESARQQINAWVAEQTADKIQGLIPAGALDPLTRLVLTTAIYFKGAWRQEFDEHHTEKIPFWTEPGSSHSVLTMRQTAQFLYGEFDGVQVLELAYRPCSVEWRSTKHGDIVHLQPIQTGGRSSNLVMNILLPSRVDGLRQIEARLTAESLETLTTLESCLVDVTIPKFKIESSFTLNQVLESLGMRRAFSPDEADFSRMSDNREGLFLSAAIHKAFVDVNEKGTEAAAATAIVMCAAGLMVEPPQPKIFLADHPFLFLIRDRVTGLIHFLGRVVEPTGSP
ncbi:MAG: FHA domain-containing protein [Planctomycetia bacterium]|nr:FHA domain-containing protein [Planctomycetia bacterium]